MKTATTNLMEAHTQWANRPADQRFETLDALREKVALRRLRSRAVDIDLGRLTAKTDEAGHLVLNGNLQPCEPSHWSFGQLAQNISAPAAYLRTLPKELLVQNINHGLAKQDAGTVKFMTTEDETGENPNTLQAVTSTTYGRIWDADVVDMVTRINERTGGKFYNPKAYAHRGDAKGFATLDSSRQVPSGLYASDHDVFIFMIDGGSRLEAGPRAKLNRGFIAFNSEVGARTMGLMTFLFNEVCGNHIIWGAQDVNKFLIRHTQGGPARFDSEAAPRLLEYCNASAKPVENTIQRAMSFKLPDCTPQNQDAIVFDWCASHGKFTKPEVRNAIAFAKAEEGDCKTLWDLVQGFTAYARGYDYVDARVDLEARAGKLLNIVADVSDDKVSDGGGQ